MPEPVRQPAREPAELVPGEVRLTLQQTHGVLYPIITPNQPINSGTAFHFLQVAAMCLTIVCRCPSMSLR